jgi:hypothetical protein
MTIRQFLMRLGSQYVRRTGAFLIAAGALVTIFTRGFVLRIACAVVILAVTLAAFLSLFKIPCPRCNKTLGLVGFKVANSGAAGRRRPAHCPHCNVSFDEPMDTLANPK